VHGALAPPGYDPEYASRRRLVEALCGLGGYRVKSIGQQKNRRPST